jgi:hypothetical protein
MKVTSMVLFSIKKDGVTVHVPKQTVLKEIAAKIE